MESKAPEQYFRISLIPIVLCMFVSPFLGSGLNLSALSISTHFSVDAQTPLWLMVVALLFAGVGFGLFSSPNTNAIMGRVSPDEFSLANTIVAAMRTVGQTVSMCLVTVIVAVNMGDVLANGASGLCWRMAR